MSDIRAAIQEKMPLTVSEMIAVAKEYDTRVVDVEMCIRDRPAPYPREVAGVVRSGYRIYELGQKALELSLIHI